MRNSIPGSSVAKITLLERSHHLSQLPIDQIFTDDWLSNVFGASYIDGVELLNKRGAMFKWTIGTLSGVFKARLFRMPTGASAVTLGALSGTPQTYTPTISHRAILWTGVLAGAAANVHTIAGFLLTDYWKISRTDGIPAHPLGDYNHATTLNAGDWCWLVYAGEFYVDSASAVSLYGALKTAANGQVTASSAVDGTYAQAEIEECIPCWGQSKCVGTMLEVLSGAGIGRAKISLPEYFG